MSTPPICRHTSVVNGSRWRADSATKCTPSSLTCRSNCVSSVIVNAIAKWGNPWGAAKVYLALQSLPLQRRHIDHEPIFHIALQHALVGFVDLLDGDHFDVRDDSVFSAEVQHLLRLGNAADQRPGKLTPLEYQ